MIKRHLLSYQYALRGIWLAFRYEPNMRIHLAAAIAVVAINYSLDVTVTEWLITLMLIGIVWMSEIFNTAVEKLADRVTKERDPLIGAVKDLAAGAVLIVCIVAVICGLMIYLPYLT
ncbi:MAG TPA: diacylglycerol kinase family protein [Chryseosolibacter sp.]